MLRPQPRKSWLNNMFALWVGASRGLSAAEFACGAPGWRHELQLVDTRQSVRSLRDWTAHLARELRHCPRSATSRPPASVIVIAKGLEPPASVSSCSMEESCHPNACGQPGRIRVGTLLRDGVWWSSGAPGGATQWIATLATVSNNPKMQRPGVKTLRRLALSLPIER